jgi:hypothetical protein
LLLEEEVKEEEEETMMKTKRKTKTMRERIIMVMMKTNTMLTQAVEAEMTMRECLITVDHQVITTNLNNHLLHREERKEKEEEDCTSVIALNRSSRFNISSNYFDHPVIIHQLMHQVQIQPLLL